MAKNIDKDSNTRSEKARRIFESSRRVRYKLASILVVLFCLMRPCFARNHPPRFLIDGQTEIVVRLKEGPGTPIGKLKFYEFISSKTSKVYEKQFSNYFLF